jgi:hypothetical protein
MFQIWSQTKNHFAHEKLNNCAGLGPYYSNPEGAYGMTGCTALACGRCTGDYTVYHAYRKRIIGFSLSISAHRSGEGQKKHRRRTQAAFVKTRRGTHLIIIIPGMFAQDAVLHTPLGPNSILAHTHAYRAA